MTPSLGERWRNIRKASPLTPFHIAWVWIVRKIKSQWRRGRDSAAPCRVGVSRSIKQLFSKLLFLISAEACFWQNWKFYWHRHQRKDVLWSCGNIASLSIQWFSEKAAKGDKIAVWCVTNQAQNCARYDPAPDCIKNSNRSFRRAAEEI